MIKKIIGFSILFLFSFSLSAGIKFSPIQLYIQILKDRKVQLLILKVQD